MPKHLRLGMAFFAGILFMTLVLAGCGSPTPSGATIEGYITVARGDGALGSAQVRLYSTSGSLSDEVTSAVSEATTTSGVNGYYSFTGVQPGSYMVVSSMTGYASCRWQQIVIAATSDIYRADLIQRPLFDPNRPALAPSFIGLTGVLAGQTVSLTVAGAATAAPAAGQMTVLPIRNIIIKYGHLSNGSDISYVDADTAEYSWNTYTAPNGASFLYFIAYDFNDNACIMQVPVTVSNTYGGIAPAAPSTVGAVAMTYNNYNEYRAPAAGGSKTPQTLQIGGKQLRVPQLSEESRAIYGERSLFVEIVITVDPSVDSYAIYRSTSASGPFTLIGIRPNDPVSHPVWYLDDALTELWYHDFDPALAMGTTYYYRVVALSSGGASSPSVTLPVTPLAPISANLTAPANNAAGVSLTPTFGWSVSSLPLNAVFVCDVYVLPSNLDDDYTLPISWEAYLVNFPTGIAYGETAYDAETQILDTIVPATALEAKTQYEWDLFYVAGYVGGYDDGSSYSYSLTLSGRYDDKGSSNGQYLFTTG